MSTAEQPSTDHPEYSEPVAPDAPVAGSPETNLTYESELRAALEAVGDRVSTPSDLHRLDTLMSQLQPIDAPGYSDEGNRFYEHVYSGQTVVKGLTDKLATLGEHDQYLLDSEMYDALDFISSENIAVPMAGSPILAEKMGDPESTGYRVIKEAQRKILDVREEQGISLQEARAIVAADARARLLLSDYAEAPEDYLERRGGDVSRLDENLDEIINDEGAAVEAETVQAEKEQPESSEERSGRDGRGWRRTGDDDAYRTQPIPVTPGSRADRRAQEWAEKQDTEAEETAEETTDVLEAVASDNSDAPEVVAPAETTVDPEPGHDLTTAAGRAAALRELYAARAAQAAEAAEDVASAARENAAPLSPEDDDYDVHATYDEDYVDDDFDDDRYTDGVEDPDAATSSKRGLLHKGAHRGGKMIVSVASKVADYFTEGPDGQFKPAMEARTEAFIDRMHARNGVYAANILNAPANLAKWVNEMLPKGEGQSQNLRYVALGAVAVGLALVTARMTGGESVADSAQDTMASGGAADLAQNGADVPVAAPEAAPAPIEAPAPAEPVTTEPDDVVAKLELHEGNGVSNEVRDWLEGDADGYTEADRTLMPELTRELLETDPNLEGIDPTRMAVGTEFTVTDEILDQARASIEAAHEEAAQAADNPAAVEGYVPDDAAGNVTLEATGVNSMYDVVEQTAHAAGMDVSDADTLQLAYRLADYNHIPHDQLSSLADKRVIHLPSNQVMAEWLQQILLERQRTVAEN